MSSPSKSETTELKAGHPPAVKAGGMRITQHKPQHREFGGGMSEDVTGLKVAPTGSSPPKAGGGAGAVVSGAVARGNADFTVDAVRAIGKDKPPMTVHQKPVSHIQQPRKQ